MGLPAPLLKALKAVGYESTTPIQAETMPHLLAGHDLLGHAPTGTGKTAAFALPALARLNTRHKHVQVMVLTPTRELAIQVAEAFRRYASHMQGFQVLPIYGGQDHSGQVRQLKRGVNVVVGTPGRVMDHMRRGTLQLDKLSTLVLDEADEMLRMGFIDDIKWILEQSPPGRQLALFSATMPKEIQRIARDYLNDPKEVTIKTKAATADTIRQRYWVVSGLHKLDALTRLLEVETFDAVLVFVRTRIATTELAEKLEARGYSTAALNGDLPQNKREKIVEKLKNGKLDILVASDVAARGLDVERISHVINYDIPYDTEAYIHRIGRTGRAGRTGDAILFVTPREKRMLHAIEKATRSKIESLVLPTTEMVNNKRIANFYQSISDTLAKGRHEYMRNLVLRYEEEHGVPLIDIAAALANLHVGKSGLLLKPEKTRPAKKTDDKRPGKDVSSDTRTRNKKTTEKTATTKREKKPQVKDRTESSDRKSKRSLESKSSIEKFPAGNASPAEKSAGLAPAEKGMEWFRFEAGKQHKLKPATVMVAISNETGLDVEFIGRMSIEATHSFIELPEGMPKAILQDLRKARICGEKMKMSRVGKPLSEPRKEKKRPSKPTTTDKTSHRGKSSSGRKTGVAKNGTPKNKKTKRKNKKPTPVD